MKTCGKTVPAICWSLILLAGCIAQNPPPPPAAYFSTGPDAPVDDDRKIFNTLGFKGLHLGMTPEQVNELVRKTPWGYENCTGTPENERSCQDAPQFLEYNRLTVDQGPMGAEWLRSAEELAESDAPPVCAYSAAQIEFSGNRLSAIGLASPPWPAGDIDTLLTRWGRCAFERLVAAYGPPDKVYFPLFTVNFFSFRPGFDITVCEWRLAHQTIRLTIGADETQNRFDCTVHLLAAAGFDDLPDTAMHPPMDTQPPTTDPNIAIAKNWLKKSYASLNRKNWTEALNYSSKAILYHPGLDAAFVNRAWAWAEIGRLDQAIQDADQALAINPRNSMASNNRGLAYQKKGDLDQALADYQNACRLGLPVACRNLQALQAVTAEVAAALAQSRLKLAAKDWNAVIQASDRVIGLAPANAEALVNRGVARLEKALFDEALADCSMAVASSPAYAPAYYWRGSALEHLGRSPAARTDYAVACDLGFGPACDRYRALDRSTPLAGGLQSPEAKLP